MTLTKKLINEILLKYKTNEANINLIVLYMCYKNAALAFRSTRQTKATRGSQTAQGNEIIKNAKDQGYYSIVENAILANFEQQYGMVLDKPTCKEDDENKNQNNLSYEKMTIEQLEQAQSRAIDDNNKDKFEMINKYIATKLKTKTLEQESIKPVFYIPARTN